MGTWTNVGSKIYYKPPNNDYDYLKKYYIQFQVYIEGNPTGGDPYSLPCRARFGHDEWTTGRGTDFFFLYFPDLSGEEKSFILHYGGDKKSDDYNYQRVIPGDTPTFYLKKKWDDDYFTLPKCYIFNQGRQGTLGKFDKTLFDTPSSKKTPSGEYGRAEWKQEISKNTKFYDGYTPQAISSPSLTSIVDNGDNTATISGTAPATANHGLKNYPFPNTVESVLWYTTDSDYEPDVAGNNRKGINLDPGSFSRVVKRIDNSDTDITWFEVDAYVESDPEYGSDKTASIVGVPINYWKAPGTQSPPKIKPIRNNKEISKVIPKCILRCQWDMAPIGNSNSSDLKYNGCRFYFAINRKGTSTWIRYGDGVDGNGRYIDIYYENKTTALTTKRNSPGFVCYKESGSNSFYIDIDSKTYNLQKGDKVQIAVRPWTNSGSHEWLGTKVLSDKVSVESAGIVNIKQSINSWFEGQVYIKSANGWLEADSVYIKDSSGWQESI